MFNLTVKHGARTANRTFVNAPTVDELKRDQGLRMELGYGDNVHVLVDGVRQSGFVQITVPFVEVETAANEKN